MHTKQNRSVNDPACQLPVWNLQTLIFKPSRTPLPKINISLSKNQIIHWILSSQLRVKFIVLEWISWSQCRQASFFSLQVTGESCLVLPHSAPHHTRLYFALNTLEHETGLQLQPRSTFLDLDQAGAICHCVYSPCIPWEGREGRTESEWAQDKAHSCG